MIKRISINADLITDWNSFHDIFKMTLGFPDFYGRNMNAWIDCMTDIDTPENGMTKVWIKKTDTLVIEIRNSESFKERCNDIYTALLECAAFVNYRKIESNEQAMIAIAAG
ncbi:MAG: barstar family protein [Bacteroidota bacterium]|nr:barstar family protein [Bacteroidota bacterium]